MSIRIIVATLAATVGIPAFAAPAQPTDYFLGRWKVSAVDPAAKEALILCYDVARFVGDRWVAGHGWSADGQFAVRDVWGQDPISGEIFRTVYDGGGTYAVVRSPGWAGDTLILEGDARSSGGVTRVRETIVRGGPDKFTATWEALRNGAWSAYSIEAVTRAVAGECVSKPRGERGA